MGDLFLGGGLILLILLGLVFRSFTMFFSLAFSIVPYSF